MPRTRAHRQWVGHFPAGSVGDGHGGRGRYRPPWPCRPRMPERPCREKGPPPVPAGKLLGIDPLKILALIKIALNGLDHLDRQLTLMHRLILMILTLHSILGQRFDRLPRGGCQPRNRRRPDTGTAPATWPWPYE